MSDEERAREWAWIEKALLGEMRRLRQNQSMFPQVAEDYTDDLRALAIAARCAKWCSANPRSAPLPPRDDAAALAAERERACIETSGFVYAYLCDAVDKGRDIRRIESPEILEAAIRALGGKR